MIIFLTKNETLIIDSTKKYLIKEEAHESHRLFAKTVKLKE